VVGSAGVPRGRVLGDAVGRTVGVAASWLVPVVGDAVALVEFSDPDNGGTQTNCI